MLLTGGAGFIGSHLADRLLAGGHAVRALDNLDPQVHPQGIRPGYLADDVELVVGDVRDHDAVGRALEGVDSVVHLAAAVGVGQSMYEIERYVSINTLGAAVLLEEILRRRDAIGKIVVASSMSIYGEGLHRCPSRGERDRAGAAARRAAGRARAGSSRLPTRQPARAGGHGRGEAAGADVRLRRHQARPRGAVPLPSAPPTRSPPSRCASSTSTGPARRSSTRTPGSRRSSRRAC